MNVTQLRKIIFVLFFLSLLAASQAIPPATGFIRLNPGEIIAPVNSSFLTTLHLESLFDTIVTYEFEFIYDAAIIQIDQATGENGVTAGPEGFFSSAVVTGPGRLTIAGEKPTGLAPGRYESFLSIQWHVLDTPQPFNKEDTTIGISIKSLLDPAGQTISGYDSGKCRVITLEPVWGDVDNNRQVNIIDALMTARYYVGINPPGFNILSADVQQNRSIDIIDALLIAQYYVGLIPRFPAGEPLPQQVLYINMINQADGDPVLSMRHYGEVEVSPPDQVINTNGYFLFNTGTDVTVQSSQTCLVSESGIDYRLDFLKWAGELTGQPVENNPITIRMDKDKSIQAYYKITMEISSE